MGAIASQITSLTIIYSTVYSDADQRKHQSSAPLAFVRWIHWGTVNSPHKWPVTRKIPFDDVIMAMRIIQLSTWVLYFLWYTLQRRLAQISLKRHWNSAAVLLRLGWIPWTGRWSPVNHGKLSEPDSLLLNWVLSCHRPSNNGIRKLMKWIWGGGTKLNSSFLSFSKFFSVYKTLVTCCVYHIHMWPQLSCADTRQIWMWFKRSNGFFDKIPLKVKLTNRSLVTLTFTHEYPVFVANASVT